MLVVAMFFAVSEESVLGSTGAPSVVAHPRLWAPSVVVHPRLWAPSVVVPSLLYVVVGTFG